MTFEPNYTITDQILNNLTEIASAREVIEQASLIPKWEVNLKRQALLNNTHASTAIEGNKLTLEQVEALSDGKKIIATHKDKQEVLNYIEALKKIPDFAKTEILTKEILLLIHGIITKKTLEKPSDSGVFRNRQVYVGKHVFDGTNFREEVVFMPPKTEEVPGLIEEFFAWLNNEKLGDLNPVLLAGIVHYEIAFIHPFIDGNGRTARLLATLVLYLKGFDHRQIFALDDYYDRDRQSYYAALGTVDKETKNITQWLEYFTQGVLSSVNEVKEKVLRLGMKSKRKDHSQIALTARQLEIVRLINLRGKITNRELQAEFNISAQAVHREMTKLVDLKVIKDQGKGRAFHYILA